MTTRPVASLVDDQLREIQADTKPALIEALQSRGFLLVKDLPGHMKVVRQAKVVEMMR